MNADYMGNMADDTNDEAKRNRDIHSRNGESRPEGAREDRPRDERDDQEAGDY